MNANVMKGHAANDGNQSLLHSGKRPAELTLSWPAPSDYPDKESGNHSYLQENDVKLQQEGFEDATLAKGDPDRFRAKLEHIREKYINWCGAHQSGFQSEQEQALQSQQQLVNNCEQRMNTLESAMQPLRAKREALQKDIDAIRQESHQKTYLAILAVTVLALVGMTCWISIYYASLFHLFTANITDLVKADGDLIPWISLNYLRDGWPMVCLVTGLSLFAGFLRSGNTHIWGLVVFFAFDIFFAMCIEARRGICMELMGEAYTFNWRELVAIILLGMGSVFFHCSLGNQLKDRLLQQDRLTKRSLTREKEREQQATDRKLDELEAQKKACLLEKANQEAVLKAKLEKSINTNCWYSANTLHGLYDAYFIGWSQFLCASPIPEHRNKVAKGLEILQEAKNN